MLVVSELSAVRGDRLLFEQLGCRLDPGELLVVRGANGAGKTTFLRILAGLTRPESGHIEWHGQVMRDGLRGQCCYAGHSPALHGDLTVGENLSFWASIGSTRRSWMDALERVGLAPQRDLEVRRLSAGQRRRAGFARILLATSPLWLLDEPVSNLDAEGRAIVDDAIREHLSAGGMAVVTSHDAAGPADMRSRDLLIRSAGRDPWR